MITIRVDPRKHGKMLIGEDLGKAYRMFLELDELDGANDKVSVCFHPDLYMSSSFLIGLFGRSVRYFRSSASTLEHYQIDADVETMKTVIRALDREMSNMVFERKNPVLTVVVWNTFPEARKLARAKAEHHMRPVRVVGRGFMGLYKEEIVLP